MLYYQLRGRRDLTKLEEALVLLVHAKLKKMELLRLEITALAGMTAENRQGLQQMVEGYRLQLFPGVRSSQDEAMEEAKAALAEEVKKVYLIRPLSEEDGKKKLAQAVNSGDPQLARWAASELRRRETEEAQAQPLRRGKGLLPPGVKPERR